jgi:hypothetical protein
MRRKGLLAAVGLSVTLSAWGQDSGSVNNTPKNPTLGIFMEFEAVPGDSSVEVMQREVTDLLKPSGISVNWRMTEQNKGDEPYQRLVVFKFNGNCRADGRASLPVAGKAFLPEPGESVSVGDAKVENGKVLPFSEVRCDEVKKALSYMTPAASQEQRQVALGIAMARVVAHELYHMLARTTSHAMKGLAKASQPLPELISNRKMTFDPHDSEAMRKGFETPPK